MARKPYGISAYESAQRKMPPLHAVVLLYDGLLRRLKGAALAARSGDLKGQIEESLQAVRIIEGLDRSLNMDQGGKVAAGLRDTYSSVGGVLLKAVGQPDGAEACEKLISAMSVLRDAWAEIAGVPLLDATSEKEQSDVEAG